EVLLGILGVWVFTAMAFRALLRIPRWSLAARYIWGTFDAALLFTVLLVADGVASPLIVCHFLLIVASGLWFCVRLVWFSTGLSLTTYAFHVYDLLTRLNQATHPQTTNPTESFDYMPDAYVNKKQSFLDVLIQNSDHKGKVSRVLTKAPTPKAYERSENWCRYAEKGQPAMSAW
ncbi:MAG: hypothetical protein ACE1Z6_12930, partial [Candidatus Methylomirabilales bacterium]